MEGALIIEMEAGLVTVHEAQGGFGGEFGEGIGNAIHGIAGWLCGGFIFEEAGFLSPGAAKTPVGSDHLLDQADLHAIGGLEDGEVIHHYRLETFEGFVAQDHVAGEQSVGGGILGRVSLALRGDRTPGASPIGP